MFSSKALRGLGCSHVVLAAKALATADAAELEHSTSVVVMSKSIRLVAMSLDLWVLCIAGLVVINKKGSAAAATCASILAA